MTDDVLEQSVEMPKNVWGIAKYIGKKYRRKIFLISFLGHLCIIESYQIK